MAERNTYGLPQGSAIRREMASIFRKQERAVLGWLHGDAQKADPPIPAAFPDWEFFRLGALPIQERIAPLIEAIWDDTGKAFAPRVGLDPNEWQVTSPHLAEQINGTALDLAESTNRTTTLQLEDALAQAREALRSSLTTGGSIDDLTKAINAIFANATTARARTIAVSEAARAYHAAQEQAAIQSEVVTGWKWLLSGDACPLCQKIARSAPAVQLGKPFAVIGEGTYSQIKHPPAHPRCQCSLVEVLDIDEQPAWAPTLINPKPDAEDYPPGEAPEDLQEAA